MDPLSPWVTTYLPLTSTLVVAAATVVLVWLTSRYVRLTGRMAEEAQKSREPSVTVDFEMPDPFLRVVIENHGLSPAKNVRITILKDVQWLEGRNGQQGLASCAPVTVGVSYLTPSRKLKYLVGAPNWSGKRDEQMEASLRVTYENEAGKPYEHVVDFDFGQLRDVLFESFKDSNLAVADAIKESERDRQSHERVRQFFGPVARRRKACPMCAELIPEKARKCSHCREIIESASPTTGKKGEQDPVVEEGEEGLESLL
jgi:hypothetical protein